MQDCRLMSASSTTRIPNDGLAVTNAQTSLRLILMEVLFGALWHDAATARTLYDKLHLLAVEPDIENGINTPLKNISTLPGQLQASGRIHEYEDLMNFNTRLVSARQAVEWGMRSLQGSFSRFLPLLLPADVHAR
ncbi:putative DDE Tnp4 domain-containing protein [Phytophthora infestans]|uniref:Putative DDE Tnp4 domain-containing protein n=1 Tax=Phytophthora infestans TaxID=4787 RepID=A0A833TB93_PHYIN|nr:putative DDE Tnp4 domain-containing protein [Phytophthora infestans]